MAATVTTAATIILRPSALTVITTTRPTPARLTATTGQTGLSAASLSALAPGITDIGAVEAGATAAIAEPMAIAADTAATDIAAESAIAGGTAVDIAAATVVAIMAAQSVVGSTVAQSVVGSTAAA